VIYSENYSLNSSDIDWADRIEAIAKEIQKTDASSLDPDKASWFAKRA
jgi:hypothetical protein